MSVLKFIIRNFLFLLVDTLVILRLKKSTTKRGLAIVRLDAIGDYVLFRNFLTILKSNPEYADKSITLIGNEAWKSLAEFLDDDVVEHFVWIDRKKFDRDLFYRLNKLLEIRDCSYEIAISYVYSREFFYSDWIVKSIRAIKKIGSVGDYSNIKPWQKKWSDSWFTDLIPARKDLMFEFDRNKEFFQQLLQQPIQISRPGIQLPEIPFPIKASLPSPYAVVFIGASVAFRKWSATNFAKVAQHLKQNHSLDIVLCGGPGERLDADNFLLAFDGECIDLVGKTSLVDLLYVLNGAELLLSNETSAPHFAMALNVPHIFVVSNGDRFGRFTPYPDHVAQNFHVIFHPSISTIASDFEAMTQLYGMGSRLDISDVNISSVLKKMDSILND